MIPEGRSTLEVLRNYTAELEAKGAKTLFQCGKAECGKGFHKLYAVARALMPEGTAYNRERRDLTANALEYVDPSADQRLGSASGSVKAAASSMSRSMSRPRRAARWVISRRR